MESSPPAAAGSRSQVLLLDSFNLLFRSFSSLPPTIVAPDGTPVNGAYGLLTTILNLWRELRPDAIVAAFDVPETPTFRHALYPNYQAQRGPLGGDRSESFQWQVEIARRVLPAIGVPALDSPGHEADDVMGTVARQVIDAGRTATIVSTDRDLTQMVSHGISILIPGKVPLEIRSDEDVRALLGVPAAGVTTFKALAGDPSDNIPGVRGVGRKGAAQLVDRYGTLEAIYAAASELPARTSNALAAGREDAFLFRDLVTIVTNLDLGLDPNALPTPRFSEESRARRILEDLEYGRAV